MLTLLNIELKKMLPHVVFRVIMVMFMVTVPLAMWGLYGKFPETIGLPQGEWLRMPELWEHLYWGASWFNLFLGFVVVLSVGNEYAQRTARQNVIDGNSRGQFIWGKVTLLSLLSFFAAIYVLLTGTLLGMAYTDTVTWDVYKEGLERGGIFLVQAFGYLTAALFLATLLRNTVLSILLYIFAVPLEAVFRWFIPNSVDRFFPLEVISNLSPWPFPTLDDLPTAPQPGQLPADAYPPGMAPPPVYEPEPHWSDAWLLPAESLSTTTQLITAAAYIVVFIGLSHLLMQRRDIR